MVGNKEMAMDEFIGRINAMGTVDVYIAEDNEPALVLYGIVDCDGVIITRQQAADFGLQIEGE